MNPATETRLGEVMRAAFDLPADVNVVALSQASHPAWDSLAHTVLMAAMESEFGLELDVSDAMELTSYAAIARFLEARGR